MAQATATRHPRGGLYFEDFVVGEVFAHRLTRTVTQMDNMLFSNMTLNPQPLHIYRHFCWFCVMLVYSMLSICVTVRVSR